MSELHFDNDGEPAQQHPQCAEVRWRRFRNPGMRGAPEVVHEKDGSPLYTFADITYLEFRGRVEGAPGRYRGDQVDAQRRVIPNATPFYVTINEAARNSNAVSTTDDLLKHVISSNVRQTEVIAERFAGMMEQASAMLRQTSEIFRIFTGANLLQRQVEPKEREEDDQEEDDDEEEEDAEIVAAHPLTPLTETVAHFIKQSQPLLTAYMRAKLNGHVPIDVSAAPAAPPAAPVATAPVQPAPAPAPPPPPPPAASGPAVEVPPGPASAVTATVAADVRNAAPAVEPTLEQMQHLLAVNEKLSSQEQQIVMEGIRRMEPVDRARWTGELCALSIEEAAALVRSMLPPLRTKPRTDKEQTP